MTLGPFLEPGTVSGYARVLTLPRHKSGMDEPKTVLGPGTKIRTVESLSSTSGMLVSRRHLDARRPSAIGTVHGIVGGHGGDVYWVQHDDGVAAYGWWDFDLVESSTDDGVAAYGWWDFDLVESSTDEAGDFLRSG